MPKRVINHLLETFGYHNLHELLHSLVHTNYLFVAALLSGVIGIIEVAVGLKSLTILAFISLALIELITGVAAGVFVKHEKFSALKFSRFGLKLTIWLILLFCLNAFAKQYESGVRFELWYFLHSSLLTYVIMEYLIGIDDNMKVIFKKQFTAIQFLIRKIKGWLKIEDENLKQPQ